MKVLLVLITLFIGSSWNFLSTIEKNRFNDVKLGKTSLKEVRSRYPKASIKKLKRFPMFRTENGRICIPMTREIVSLKKDGVNFYSNYHSNKREDSVFVYQIEFIKPFKGKTEEGIGINSLKKEVVAAYGEDNNDSNKGNDLNYDWIEFTFEKDSVEKIKLNFVSEE